MSEFKITVAVKRPEPDRRYRILVTLQRADRPKYWIFHCPHCATQVCELQNYDIYDMTDFYDPQNTQNGGVMPKRCTGATQGVPCRFWYYFNLG